MKRIILLISCMIICTTFIEGCNHQSTSSMNSSAVFSSTEEMPTSDSFSTTVEATYTLASYIRSEAAFYKWSNDTPNTLYGTIQDDNGFGTILLNEYPQLRNMEYIIIFSGTRPDTVFLHQPQEKHESIGVSGKVSSIEELNVHSWNELLDHYNIHN